MFGEDRDDEARPEDSGFPLAAAGAPGSPAEPRRRRFPMVIGAIVVAIALLAGGIGIGWGLRGGDPGSSVVGGRSEDSNGPLTVDEIAERVSPAVVSIYTGSSANPFSSEGRQRVFPRGAGTGMVLTSSGQVLTANHVVSGATSITVEIDGRSGRFPARVVGASPSSDVALLQIHGVSGLPTVRLGESEAVREGDEVVAIGNARGEGFPQTSSGTVTGLNRSIAVGEGREILERLSGLIQTDAPVEQGQSGGPIVNTKAEVVGMITAARRTVFRDEDSGTAFAIPSSASLRIVNEVRAGRASSTIFIGPVGYMGISVEEVTPALAGRLGLSATSGALVVNAYTGGPA